MFPKTFRRLLLATLATISLAGCGSGKESLCTDTKVLTTLKQLVDKQELGPLAEQFPNVHVIDTKSATYISEDPQRGSVRCSAIVVMHLSDLLRAGVSEDDLAKMKAANVPLSKELNVNFTVQPMANGQFYVTLLR